MGRAIRGWRPCRLAACCIKMKSLMHCRPAGALHAAWLPCALPAPAAPCCCVSAKAGEEHFAAHAAGLTLLRPAAAPRAAAQVLSHLAGMPDPNMKWQVAAAPLAANPPIVRLLGYFLAGQTAGAQALLPVRTRRAAAGACMVQAGGWFQCCSWDACGASNGCCNFKPARGQTASPPHRTRPISACMLIRAPLLCRPAGLCRAGGRAVGGAQVGGPGAAGALPLGAADQRHRAGPAVWRAGQLDARPRTYAQARLRGRLCSSGQGLERVSRVQTAACCGTAWALLVLPHLPGMLCMQRPGRSTQRAGLLS